MIFDTVVIYEKLHAFPNKYIPQLLSEFITKCGWSIIYKRQPTVPPQTDSTQARSYTTYSRHKSFFTGVLLHKRGPTRSCYVWHRQPIQHTVFLHMLRYCTRQYYTAPNSPQTDSTRPRFNTTRFYTSVVLHKAGPAPPFPVSTHEYISGR